MKKEGLTSVGAVALAFLASQHHTLHMLILTLGVGGAGVSFMAVFPVVRRAMLLMSLVMVGVTIYQIWRAKRPVSMRIVGGVSVVATVGLVLWSIIQFGV